MSNRFFLTLAIVLISLSITSETIAGIANVYIDATQSTPVVWSDDSSYWTSPPFNGLHSSVTQLGPGHWDIDIGLVGAFRSWVNSNRGLELTDSSGDIIYSWGIDTIYYNDLYSWTTIHSQLFTLDDDGVLAGRTPRVNNAQIASTQITPDSYQLAKSITTEWDTWNIWLKGALPAPVPVPEAIWLLGSGLIGIAGIRRR